ncbi:hypothetical protein DFJ73DRAFT_769506 [Zopfochytrium polystomum]|nr:hypothetical protein DFJ73DRAFT_769506 [Zopfochytrium polystomum]
MNNRDIKNMRMKKFSSKLRNSVTCQHLVALMTPASTFGQYGNLNNKGDADAIAGWFAIVSDRVTGELVALANGFVGDSQTGLKWISEKHLARCRQWGDVPTSLWSRRSNKQDNRQCNCHCPKAKLLGQLLQLCVISGARTLGHLVGRGSGGDFRMGNLTVKNRLTLRGTDPPPSFKLPLLAIPTQTVCATKYGLDWAKKESWALDY